MRWSPLLVLWCATGCEIFFSDGGSRPDRCDLAEPAVVREQLDPSRLECHAFGGGGTCDPECGPCPLDTQPAVTWGFCDGPCWGANESTCTTDDRCRVIRDLECELGGNCFTTFVACVPTDQIVDPAVDCDRTTDAQRCSQSPRCTAWHVTNVEARVNDDGGLPVRVFKACSVEGTSPGRCHDPVTCDQAAPSCPIFEVPLVKDGCYTGACVREVRCEPM